MNNDPYDGWEGFCHPDAPAGGGGPGFFRSAYPAGMDVEPLADILHPQAPAAKLLAAKQGGTGQKEVAGGSSDVSQDRPADYEKWFYVTASREGLVGGTTASGRKIEKDSIFVALPSRKALGLTVELFYKGKTATAPVWDVGPWNTKDAYWLDGSRPQAESGKDLFDRKTNKAGIDLSDALFEKLGLKGNDWVYWRFVGE